MGSEEYAPDSSWTAAYRGELALVASGIITQTQRKLIKQGKKWAINRLSAAAYKGELEKVKELIGDGGQCHSLTKSEEFNVLRQAVQMNRTEIAKLLLAKGFQVTSKQTFYPIGCLLYYAIRNGDLDILKLLLDRGVDINGNTDESVTHFDIAISSNNKEIIELLLHREEYYADINKNGVTLLIVAVQSGYLHVVEHLLNYGVYIDCESTSTFKAGYTPLCFAVETGHEEIVKLLLSRGANSNAKPGRNKTTPLHIAVRGGHIQLVELLLQHGAFVDAQDADGKSSVLYAICGGHIQIVELLLQHGAFVNAQDAEGKSSVFYAVRGGHIQIVELLFQYGAFVDAQDGDEKSSVFYPIINDADSKIVQLLLTNKANMKDYPELLTRAVAKENIELVEVLLQHGANVNTTDSCVHSEYLHVVERLIGCESTSTFKADYTPLCFAVGIGKEEIVKLLLTYGANSKVRLGRNRTTPLHMAVRGGHVQIVELLLQYGAFVDAQDADEKSSIFYAIINDADLKIVQLLLTYNAKVKGYPELLTHAVEKQNIEMVKVLLQHGANVNATDKYGETALHLTAVGKQLFGEDPDVKGEIAKLLLSRGANVNDRTPNGSTTLHVAVRKQYVKVVEALLEYNVDVNSKNLEYHRTPLHISASTNNEVISKMLLSKGANINAGDNREETALHIACSRGKATVVEILLRSGAKPDLKMECGYTPLHLAVIQNFIEIVELLLKYDADIDAVNETDATALNLAFESKNTQIFRVLLKYGADINILLRIKKTSFDWLFRDNEIVMSLQHHLVKMKTANLHIIKEYLPSVSLIINGLSDFKHECEEEIVNMKREKINNYVSFYDILTKDISQLAIYAENESIVQVLRSDDYKTKFPVYATMIESNFKKGKRRKELLEVFAGRSSSNSLEGFRVVHFLLGNFPEFPYLCIDKIISYLSNADLKLLVEACQFTKVSSSNSAMIL